MNDSGGSGMGLLFLAWLFGLAVTLLTWIVTAAALMLLVSGAVLVLRLLSGSA